MRERGNVWVRLFVLFKEKSVEGKNGGSTGEVSRRKEENKKDNRKMKGGGVGV